MRSLSQLMKQTFDMQSKIQDMRARLAEFEVEGQAGAGMVTVTMDGRAEVRRVRIAPDLFDASDAGVVEDLLVTALNDAKSKANALLDREMDKLTAGIPLPPELRPRV